MNRLRTHVGGRGHGQCARPAPDTLRACAAGRRTRSARLALIILTVGLAVPVGGLAGCGQTGPLVLPRPPAKPADTAPPGPAPSRAPAGDREPVPAGSDRAAPARK